jgi:hypothetical protein
MRRIDVSLEHRHSCRRGTGCYHQRRSLFAWHLLFCGCREKAAVVDAVVVVGDPSPSSSWPETECFTDDELLETGVN